jgi:hypothetical protein
VDLGRYRDLTLVGKGGSGSVFRARAPDGSAVAIKLLAGTDAERRARFDRERRLLAAFGEAEGFVPLVDFETGRDAHFLVMPFLPGGTLRSRLERGVLEPEAAVALGRALATALGCAHERGIVHRDLKPENVLFTADGRPLIADLGLAKHFDRAADGGSQSVSLSVETGWRGTAGYMSPEQIGEPKHVGPPADVFALGAILYECLAGRPAFPGETLLDVVAKVCHGTVEPLARLAPGAPSWLVAVVERALSTSPEERFQDGHELAHALATRRAPRARRRGKRGLLLGAGVAAIVALVAVLAPRVETPGAPDPALERLLDALDPEAPGIDRTLVAARTALAGSRAGASLAWRADLVEAEAAWLRGDLARVASLAASLPADARTRRLAALRASDRGSPEEALASLAPVASASELLARAFALVRAGREAEGLAALGSARISGAAFVHARAALVLAAAGRFEKAEAEPLGEPPRDVELVRDAILAAHALGRREWPAARAHVAALASSSSPWRAALVAPVLSLCRAGADPGRTGILQSEVPELARRFERCSNAFELAALLSPGERAPSELPAFAQEVGLRLGGTDILGAYRAHRFALLHGTTQELNETAIYGFVNAADSAPISVEEALDAFALALSRTTHPEYVVLKEILFLRDKNRPAEAAKLAYAHPGLALIDVYAASFRVDAGELEEARAIFRRLDIADTFDEHERWLYHRTLGRLLDQPAASREDLERVVEEGRRTVASHSKPDRQRAGFALEGDALERLGRPEESALAWRRCANPSGPLRRRIARLLLLAGKREDALAELAQDPDAAALVRKLRAGEDVTAELARTQGQASDEF